MINIVSRLPAGYQEVEYIQSDGAQYIDTGFTPNQDTRVVIDTMPLSIANISTSGDGFSPYGAGNSPYFECYSWSSAILFAYKTQENRTTPIAVEGRVTIDHNKNVVTTTDSNGNVYTVTFSYASFTTNSTLGLCCLNRTTKYWGKQRIYSCQVYDNGTLVRNLVPCYRIANNAAGMYDLAKGTFYGNAGTGAFSVGSNVGEIVISAGGVIPQKYALRRRMLSVEIIKPDENTILLLHGEDLTDSSKYEHTVTNSGVTVSAAQSKFGGSSLYFNGSSSKLTINSDLFNFGSGDFTVDWWEYITATPATRFTISYNNGWGGICAGGSGNTNILYVSSIEPWDMFQANAFSTTLNAWVHWAVVRSGNKFYTFRNGAMYWSGDGSGAVFWNGAGFVVGAFPYDSSHYFGGYIDEFRVSNVARWTENFMPPTKPYDNVKLPSGGDSGGDSITRTVTLSGSFRYGDAGCWVEIGGSVIESSGTYTVNDGDAIVLCALKRSIGALITIEVNGAVVASTSSADQLLTYTLTATSDINVVGTIGENDAGSLVVTTV